MQRISSLRRKLYAGIGLLCFGLGFAGAFLPVLPTTPFMLLALWAFSRSSQRLHDWLYHHPRFGPPLQRWQQYRVIPRPAKLGALALMSASALIVYWSPHIPSWAQLAAWALIAVGAVFILSCPSRVPEQDSEAA